MAIDVFELLVDDDNEAKLASHGVTVSELLQAFTDAPRYFRNGAGRRASHVMIGKTLGGRLLLVPIERIKPGTWRPVTAMDPTTHQAGRYQ